MRWFTDFRALALAAAALLVVVVGGCGSSITVPDQGVIVTGCQIPANCFKTDCACKRLTLTADCQIDSVCSVLNDLTSCNCPNGNQDMYPGLPLSMCVETAQVCVGKGVFCGGAGAFCQPAVASGTVCGAPGTTPYPPQLVPTIDPVTGLPALMPFCTYQDDVCCGGSDGGVTTD